MTTNLFLNTLATKLPSTTHYYYYERAVVHKTAAGSRAHKHTRSVVVLVRGRVRGRIGH